MSRGKLPAELYEPQEVAALLRSCGRSRTGRRNQALIALLAGAGLRVSEALALEPRDVSFKRHEIRVRRGKGSKARTVTLDATTAALIEQWLQVRPAEARSLISTLEGQPVKPSPSPSAPPRCRSSSLRRRAAPRGRDHLATRVRRPRLGRDRVRPLTRSRRKPLSRIPVTLLPQRL
jgi:integrase